MTMVAIVNVTVNIRQSRMYSGQCGTQCCMVHKDSTCMGE